VCIDLQLCAPTSNRAFKSCGGAVPDAPLTGMRYVAAVELACAPGWADTPQA